MVYNRQEAKKEANKQVQLEKLMKDLSTNNPPSKDGRVRAGGLTGDEKPGAGIAPGKNPFGPHGINEREDRWYDEEGAEDEDEGDLENDDELGPDAERGEHDVF